jgi:hypothetical protein
MPGTATTLAATLVPLSRLQRAPGTRARSATHASRTSAEHRDRPRLGVPEGQVRWYCSSRQKGFYLPAGEEPSACPEGHAVVVEDELAIVEA